MPLLPPPPLLLLLTASEFAQQLDFRHVDLHAVRAAEELVQLRFRITGYRARRLPQARHKPWLGENKDKTNVKSSDFYSAFSVNCLKIDKFSWKIKLPFKTASVKIF